MCYVVFLSIVGSYAQLPLRHMPAAQPMFKIPMAIKYSPRKIPAGVYFMIEKRMSPDPAAANKMR